MSEWKRETNTLAKAEAKIFTFKYLYNHFIKITISMNFLYKTGF